jgi:hypothetical protein
MRWLAVEIADATGDQRSKATNQGYLRKTAALEALSDSDRQRAVRLLIAAGGDVAAGGPAVDALRLSHAVVLLLFLLGEDEAGLNAAENVASVVES